MKYLTNIVVLDNLRKGNLDSIGSYLESTKHNHDIFKMLEEDDITFITVEERDELLYRIRHRIKWNDCIENFYLRPIENKELIEYLKIQIDNDVLSSFIRE